MNRRTLITGLGASLLWPLGAEAWRLPTPHIIRRVNRRLARARGLQVGLIGRTAEAAVGERWIFGAGPTATRLDVNGPGGSAASWRRGGRPEGQISLLPDPTTFEILATLFGDGDLRPLIRLLGVDTTRASLALAWGAPARVLGAGPRDRRRPQIWIDPRGFTVIRVRARTRAGAYDLRLREWEGPPALGTFPQRLEVVEGGRHTRRLALDTARLGG